MVEYEPASMSLITYQMQFLYSIEFLIKKEKNNYKNYRFLRMYR